MFFRLTEKKDASFETLRRVLHRGTGGGESAQGKAVANRMIGHYVGSDVRRAVRRGATSTGASERARAPPDEGEDRDEEPAAKIDASQPPAAGEEQEEQEQDDAPAEQHQAHIAQEPAAPEHTTSRWGDDSDDD